MKTLQHHVILYDADCPMCNAYTQLFVSSRMLPNNGRATYQDAPIPICPLIDKQRAANEIALVNTETGEVTYGIKSLFKIIGNAIPLLRPIFALRPFLFLMTKFYAFISYNRKVIIPVAMKPNQVQPDFKLHYRLAYLLCTWLATAYILTAYAHLLTDFVPIGSKYREYLICGAQMLFQGIVITFYNREKLWEYLGNMMTISFAGSLLLSLGLLWATHLHINSSTLLIYFLLVAGLMFIEHIRRCKILQLGWLLSLSWAVYRLIVLALILILQ